MAKLSYSAITSLDGYIADESGDFGWAEPDEEVHAFVNDLERKVGTYLYGRRLYEVMLFWDTAQPADMPAVHADYARIWQAADKVVYSSTLDAVTSPRTTLQRRFDPAAVRRMTASAERDVSVGGATLAGQALLAGVVDECHLLVVPVIVGNGTRCLPDGARRDLELLDERRFAGGTVYLRYGVVAAR